MGRATCLSLVGDAAHFLVCQSLWPCLNTITLNLLSPHVPEIQRPGQIHKPCGKTNLPVTGRLDPCVCRAPGRAVSCQEMSAKRVCFQCLLGFHFMKSECHGLLECRALHHSTHKHFHTTAEERQRQNVVCATFLGRA